MYAKVVSDLHEEHGLPFYFQSDVRDQETIMIISGDLTSGKLFKDTVEYYIQTTNFAGYIFLAGNHEFYGMDYFQFKNDIGLFNIECQKKYPNKQILITTDFNKIRFQDTIFLCGTMWTDGGKSVLERQRVGLGLNDFYVIKNGTLRFTVDNMRKEFSDFVNNLSLALEKVEENTKVVLVTHHLPTYNAIAPEFQTSDINGGFAVELSSYLKPELMSKIDVMCFGHTHSVVKRKSKIPGINKKIQLICNPRGYPRSREGKDFDKNLLFDLRSMEFEL